MNSEHNRHHHNHHHHASKNLLWALALNLFFSIFEFIGAWLSGSIAILADAIHDLGDSLSLGLAWILERWATKGKDHLFSYGYKRLSLLSSLLVGFALVIASLFIMFHSFNKLSEPGTPKAPLMLGFAVIGVIINSFAFFRIHGGGTQNEKIISLHLLEDILGWVAVLIGAVIIHYTKIYWIDPALALGLSAYILFNALINIKHTLFLFLQGRPEDFDEKSFVKSLMTVPGVTGVHDLHIWSLDGMNHILSYHLCIKNDLSLNEIVKIKSQCRRLTKQKDLVHSTIEIEPEGDECEQNCDHF